MAPADYLTTWTFGERLSHLLAFAAATGRLSRIEVEAVESALDAERRLAVAEELRRRELVAYLLAPIAPVAGGAGRENGEAA